MFTIARRELLDHLQSLHFVILLCVSIFLFAVDGVVYSRRYVDQTARYTRNSSDLTRLASTVTTNTNVEPSPFLFMSAAGDARQPSSYTLRPAGRPMPEPGRSGRSRLPEVPELDWAFIVKIIFSLYVVLLSFDAVCGEKADGTLRQTLSHPLGRLQLLMGKFAAIMVSTLLPLLAGSLISLLILNQSIPSLLAPAALGRVIGFLLLCLLYLSVFALLSLMASALMHDASLVLLTVLVAWVMSAVILPNTSGVIADGLTTAPSEYQAAKQMGPVLNQRMQDGLKAIADRADRGELTTEEDVQREYDRLCAGTQVEIARVYETYDNALQQRARLARNVSRLSPTALFQYSSEGIAGTGTPREERVLQDIREYAKTYDAYVLKKVGTLVSSTNWSFAATLDVGGKPVQIRSPFPVEYQGDKSDFPRFVLSRPSTLDGARDALMDSAGLILWNILLAFGAAWAILRADVR